MLYIRKILSKLGPTPLKHEKFLKNVFIYDFFYLTKLKIFYIIWKN